MKLVLIISTENKTVRLVNVEASNTETSCERDLDTWACPPSCKDLRYTVWNNRAISEINPYIHNRVNVHYTDNAGMSETKSYYCIHYVILLDSMTFNNFDSSIID